MDDPRSAFQRMMIQGMLGVRNNEAPPVPGPVAGGGYERPVGKNIVPSGGPYPSTPTQIGGLFGSDNTTTVDASGQGRGLELMLQMLALLIQQAGSSRVPLRPAVNPMDPRIAAAYTSGPLGGGAVFGPAGRYNQPYVDRQNSQFFAPEEGIGDNRGGDSREVFWKDLTAY